MFFLYFFFLINPIYLLNPSFLHITSFDWSFLLKSKVKRGIEGLQLLSVSGEVNFPRLCFNIWPSKMGLLRSVIQSFSAKKLPKPAPRTKFQGYLKVRASHMNTWSWKWAVLTEKKLSIYSSSTAKKSQVAYKLITYSRFDTMKGPAGFICVQLLSAQPKIIDDLLLLCPEASAIDWIKHFRSVVFQSLAVMSIDLEEEAETAKEKGDEFYLTALFQWDIKIDYVSFVVQDSHQSSSNKIIAEISGLTLQEQVNEHSHQLDLCIHNLSIRDLVDGAESIVLSTKPAKDNRGLSRSDSHYFRLIITQNWTENWIVEEPNLIVTGRLGTLVVGVDTTFISFAEKLKNLLMPSKEKSFDSPDDDDDVHAEEQSGSDIDESYDIEFIPLISRKFNPISKCKQFSLSIDCLRVQLSLERGSIPWLYGEIRSTTCAADFTARTMNVMACIKSATIWAIQAIPIEGNGALKEVTIFDSSPSNQDVAFLKIMFETYSRVSDFPGMDSRFLYIFGPIKLNLHPEYAYPVIDFLQRSCARSIF